MFAPAWRRGSVTRFIGAFCGFFLLTISAAPPLAAETRGHGAHVHGHGRLNIAVEDRTVIIELLAPGADIVGFEHRPRTQAHRDTVRKAVASLKSGAKLFAFPDAARCRLESANVESDHIERDRDHRHEDTVRVEEAHAEFHARYNFLCDHPNHLSYLDVRVFTQFPALGELEAQAITSRGQIARDLKPGSARLTF